MPSRSSLAALAALPTLAALLVLPVLACSPGDHRSQAAAVVPPAAAAEPEDRAPAEPAEPAEPTAEVPAAVPANHAPAVTGAPDSAAAAREPNELGRVMILEYHLIGDRNARWERERTQFRHDLQLLYDRGYRPVTMRELLDRKLDLPRGLSPVVVTFDDASPSQFRYVERDGKLEIDPTSAVGIWLDFARTHPGWGNKAVFCLLPGAEAGRSFFGNKGIEGQKTEWRFQKVRFLAEQGFELCNHTLWHANLGQYGDAMVQEQIARGVMAIDSAVPGYKVRTFALPLGVWPKNRQLAYRGSWREPKTGRVVSYAFDAVLEVSGGPTRGPYDPAVTVPGSFRRVQVTGNELQRTLDWLDRSGERYVSDGDPRTVARPTKATTAAGGS
ncbi:MAG TPA: polysaccharide deacetylase family protein [Gemmatimonadaceae bacterium]|nr:polysaccharide deacetylase family protein [Gemmatimonadaceae bacterium]